MRKSKTRDASTVTPRHNTGCAEKRPREEAATSTTVWSFIFLFSSRLFFLSLFLYLSLSLSFRSSHLFTHSFLYTHAHSLPPLPFLLPSMVLYYYYYYYCSFFSGFLKFLEFPSVVCLPNDPLEGS